MYRILRLEKSAVTSLRFVRISNVIEAAWLIRWFAEQIHVYSLVKYARESVQADVALSGAHHSR